MYFLGRVNRAKRRAVPTPQGLGCDIVLSRNLHSVTNHGVAYRVCSSEHGDALILSLSPCIILRPSWTEIMCSARGLEQGRAAPFELLQKSGVSAIFRDCQVRFGISPRRDSTSAFCCSQPSPPSAATRMGLAPTTNTGTRAVIVDHSALGVVRDVRVYRTAGRSGRWGSRDEAEAKVEAGGLSGPTPVCGRIGRCVPRRHCLV